MDTNIKEDKYLIIYNSVPYFFKYLNQDNVKAYNTYSVVSALSRIIRLISRKFNILQEYWYEDWKNELKTTDTIVVFAPLQDSGIIRYIKKVNPDTKIIYWFWNPVYRVGLPNKKITSGAEIWSFDPKECEEFNMRFNTTFYFKEISLPEVEIEYDVVFVGADKGRGAELKTIEQNFKKLGLRVLFYIVPDKSDEAYKKNKPITYDKYLEIVAKSKSILDITPEGQSGLTLRPMESIFFEKKLITTDLNIVDQDFYNNRNIFVLGKDDKNDLKNFTESNYKTIDKEIVHKYDINEWIKRFNE